MNMKQMIRKSRTLELLRAGETVFMTKSNLADARVVEIAGLAGFPCIWVDYEHVPNDLRVIEDQVWAGKAHDMDVMVRVPRGPYSDYIHPLEMDAAGIMVPHVMSPEDAEKVVWMTRFHPEGRRPVDGGNADGLFTMLPQADYTGTMNHERFVVLQIEDPEAMEAVDEIAAVPGYDVLFFGPGDYSHSIGHSGEMDHPDVVAGFRKVAEAALRHGKYAGTVAGPGNAKERIEMGYRLLGVGADVVALSIYFNETMEALRAAVN